MKRNHLRNLVFVVVICLIAAVLLGTTLYDWDKQAVIKFNACRSPLSDWIFLSITYSAGVSAYGVAVYCLAYSFASITAERRRQLHTVVAGVVMSGITATLLKRTVHRIRPYHMYPVIHHLGPGGGWSFPSGHTCDAVALATALSLSFAGRNNSLWLVCWAVLVGVSRVYLGVHYPSDVLGGLSTGCGMAVLGYLLVKFYYQPRIIYDTRRP